MGKKLISVLLALGLLCSGCVSDIGGDPATLPPADDTTPTVQTAPTTEATVPPATHATEPSASDMTEPPTTDATEPIPTDPPETVITQLVSDGTLTETEGARMIAKLCGIPDTVPWNGAQLTLVRQNEDVNVAFTWCEYGDALYTAYDRLYCSVTPVPGSDHLLEINLKSQATGDYAYLYDTSTGEVLDPMALLSKNILENVEEIFGFSPDGSHLLLRLHSGKNCMLVECETGKLLPLPFPSADLSNSSGYFLDDSNVLLTYTPKNGNGYHLARYCLTTGMLTEYPGEHTAKDKEAENYLSVLDSETIAKAQTDGCLTIIDLMTWEHITTDIPLNAVKTLYRCGPEKIAIIADGILYLVDYDINIQPLCKVDP